MSIAVFVAAIAISSSPLRRRELLTASTIAEPAAAPRAEVVISTPRPQLPTSRMSMAKMGSRKLKEPAKREDSRPSMTRDMMTFSPRM